MRDPMKRREISRSPIDRCHRRGSKVVTDPVPNHVSRQCDGTHTSERATSLGVQGDRSKASDSNNSFYYFPGSSLQLPDHSPNYHEEPVRMTGSDCWSATPSANDWYKTVKLNCGMDYRPDRSSVAHSNLIPAT